MTVEELRQQFHKNINQIDDEEFLQALLKIIESYLKSGEDIPTFEEIEIVEQRYAAYLRGEVKAISLEEFNTGIKEKYGI